MHPSTPFVVAALVALLVLAAWEWVRFLQSVYQWFLERSARADRDSVSSSSLPGEGGHEGPPAEQSDQYRSSHGRLLSSPHPARCSADPESGVFAVPAALAAIDPNPDFSAFGAGVELMIFTALFTIGALLVLNWIIKTMRAGD